VTCYSDAAGLAPAAAVMGLAPVTGRISLSVGVGTCAHIRSSPSVTLGSFSACGHTLSQEAKGLFRGIAAEVQAAVSEPAQPVWRTPFFGVT